MNDNKDCIMLLTEYDAAQSLSLEGHYQKAVYVLTALKDSLNLQSSNSSVQGAKIILELIRNYLELGDYAKVDRSMKEYDAIAIQNPYVKDTFLGEYLLCQGDILQVNKLTTLAVKAYEDAKTFFKDQEGKIAKYIASMRGEASALLDLFDFKESKRILDEAYTFTLENLGPDHIEMSRNEHLLARLALSLNEYKKAENYLNSSIKIKRKFYLEGHQEIGQDYMLLGAIYRELTLYDESIDLIEQALDLFKRFFDTPHHLIAKAYLELAKSEENYEILKAKEYYDLAILTAEQVYGNNHPFYAEMLLQASYALRISEHFDQALEYTFRAKNIFEQALGNKHPYIAYCYLGLSRIMSELEAFEESLKHNQISIDISTEALTESHPNTATAFSMRSKIYKKQKNYQEAKKLLQKSSQIDINYFGPDNIQVNIDYIDMARLLLAENSTDTSICFEKGFKYFIKVFGANHPIIADKLVELAMLEISKKNVKEAQKILDDAKKILTRWYSSTHWRLAAIEKEAGKLEAYITNLKNANTLLDRAKSLLMPNLHYSYASEDIYMTQIELNLEEYPKKALLLQKQGLEVSEKIRGPKSLVLGCSMLTMGDAIIELGSNPREGLKLVDKGYKILKEYPSMVQFAERTMVGAKVKIAFQTKDYARCLSGLKKDIILGKKEADGAALNQVTLLSLEQICEKLKLDLQGTQTWMIDQLNLLPKCQLQKNIHRSRISQIQMRDFCLFSLQSILFFFILILTLLPSLLSISVL